MPVHDVDDGRGIQTVVYYGASVSSDLKALYKSVIIIIIIIYSLLSQSMNVALLVTFIHLFIRMTCMSVFSSVYYGIMLKVERTS